MLFRSNGGGYDTVVLGQNQPPRIDLDALDARLARPDFARVVQSLQVVGFGSISSLLGTYAGQRTDLEPWLAGAEINRDRNLRLQYLAGMSLNVYQSKHIYDEIAGYRKFPQDLFVGSGMRNTALRWALELENSVP